MLTHIYSLLWVQMYFTIIKSHKLFNNNKNNKSINIFSYPLLTRDYENMSYVTANDFTCKKSCYISTSIITFSHKYVQNRYLIIMLIV